MNSQKIHEDFFLLLLRMQIVLIASRGADSASSMRVKAGKLDGFTSSVTRSTRTASSPPSITEHYGGCGQLSLRTIEGVIFYARTHPEDGLETWTVR